MGSIASLRMIIVDDQGDETQLELVDVERADIQNEINDTTLDPPSNARFRTFEATGKVTINIVAHRSDAQEPIDIPDGFVVTDIRLTLPDGGSIYIGRCHLGDLEQRIASAIRHHIAAGE